MRSILALVALMGAIGVSSNFSFGAVDIDNQEIFLEAALDRTSEGGKKWKGHVQRIIDIVDGHILGERFIARAAFSTKSFDVGGNKTRARQGVILKLSNSDGLYAYCHLPLKNFDVDLKDWELVTEAAFSVSFDARMKREQWIVKKGKKDAFCDINPGQPDAHLGMPEIQPEDLVEVLELGVKVLEGEVRLQND